SGRPSPPSRVLPRCSPRGLIEAISPLEPAAPRRDADIAARHGGRPGLRRRRRTPTVLERASARFVFGLEACGSLRSATLRASPAHGAGSPEIFRHAVAALPPIAPEILSAPALRVVAPVGTP